MGHYTAITILANDVDPLDYFADARSQVFAQYSEGDLLSLYHYDADLAAVFPLSNTDNYSTELGNTYLEVSDTFTSNPWAGITGVVPVLTAVEMDAKFGALGITDAIYECVLSCNWTTTSLTEDLTVYTEVQSGPYITFATAPVIEFPMTLSRNNVSNRTACSFRFRYTSGLVTTVLAIQTHFDTTSILPNMSVVWRASIALVQDLS
jgi:hypothetical protein